MSGTRLGSNSSLSTLATLILALCVIFAHGVVGAAGQGPSADLRNELLRVRGDSADPASRARIGQLLAAVESGNARDQANAARNLAAYAGVSARAREALAELLVGGDVELRNEVILAVAQEFDLDPNVEARAVAQVVGDSDEERTLDALRQLGRMEIGPAARNEVAAALDRAAASDSNRIARRAARTRDRIGAMADPGTERVEPDPDRRVEALPDVGGNQPPAEDVAAALQRVQYTNTSADLITLSWIDSEVADDVPANRRDVRVAGAPGRGNSSAFPDTRAWDLRPGDSVWLDVPPGTHALWVAYPRPRPGSAHRLELSIDAAGDPRPLAVELAGGPGAPAVAGSASAAFVRTTDRAPALSCSATAPGRSTVGPRPSAVLEVSAPEEPLILEVLQETPLGLRVTAADPEGRPVRTVWTTRGSSDTVGNTVSGSTIESGATLGNERRLPPLDSDTYAVFLTAYDEVGLFDECRFDMTVVRNTPPVIEVIAEQQRLGFGRADETRVTTAAIEIPTPVPSTLCPFPEGPYADLPTDLESVAIPDSSVLDHPSRTCVWAPWFDATVPPDGVRFEWQELPTNFGGGNLYTSLPLPPSDRFPGGVALGTLIRDRPLLDAYNDFWTDLGPAVVPSVVWEAPDDPMGTGLGGDHAVVARVSDGIAPTVRDEDLIVVGGSADVADASDAWGLQSVRTVCGFSASMRRWRASSEDWENFLRVDDRTESIGALEVERRYPVRLGAELEWRKWRAMVRSEFPGTLPGYLFEDFETRRTATGLPRVRVEVDLSVFTENFVPRSSQVDDIDVCRVGLFDGTTEEFQCPGDRATTRQIVRDLDNYGWAIRRDDGASYATISWQFTIDAGRMPEDRCSVHAVYGPR